MVGLTFDCLANPLGAVRLTFEKAVAAAVSSGLDPSITFSSGADWGALDVFRNFLFNQGGLSHVPILDPTNLHWIQPNTLVRFRGMVQDMLGNEFYVGAFKDGSTWRTNKFTDIPSYPIASSSEMRVWERRLLYCIPVPGQNSWVVEQSPSETMIKRCSSSSSQHGEKRPRDTATDLMEFEVSNHELMDPSSFTKKQAKDALPSQSFQTTQESVWDTCSEPSVPEFDRNSLPCLVKIYDTPEADLKLNDVFEFIGVFTFDPELAVHKDNSDEFSNGLCDDALVHLPPSKVPRLHCLVHRKLSVQDFLLSPRVIEPVPSSVRGIREALLRHLTAVLGNDGVAAQCMLLHLLSRVHARVEALAVGKLSLNLTGLSSEAISIFGNQISLAIQSLLPFTQSILLTVEYLNTAALGPKKDYKSNRLLTGVLQLAQGTHLIIDETQLQSGTLNATGVANAQLLKNLMESQKVDYEFQFYKMEMAADVQVLILSEGKSNILPADLVLPFRPAAVSSTINATTTAEELESWRWYLAALRSLPHTIEAEMQKTIEDDMVAARRVDRRLGSEDFSRWLTMARLMSASFGETSLSMEHWQMVKELERLRKERLK
ncbi:mini-chromosome maintenance complex-binding protein isoform X1 [Magnolia sinica]|uniref:mini-chromosome maintenance complex-binding protein isoform X1 n=1 Tax=Magnolia sinica TaxID=86752 RepID=UPI002658E0F5|nr:mini-chromosome maintenance complex-binding protein isoform X1 [Magnolia sinica]